MVLWGDPESVSEAAVAVPGDQEVKSDCQLQTTCQRFQVYLASLGVNLSQAHETCWLQSEVVCEVAL